MAEKKDPRTKLASFLREKREAAGLSQRDVADKLHYTTAQFISNWERGVSNPPVMTLKRLGDLYHISSEELFEVTLSTVIEQVTRDLKRKFANAKSR